MSLEIFTLVVFLLSTVGAYYYWNKRKDKDYLRFFWWGLAAILVDILDYFIKNSSKISPEIKLLSHIVVIVFWPILVFMILRILLKNPTQS